MRGTLGTALQTSPRSRINQGKGAVERGGGLGRGCGSGGEPVESFSFVLVAGVRVTDRWRDEKNWGFRERVRLKKVHSGCGKAYGLRA